MSLLLSLETATKVCSVALHEDSRLLVAQHLHIDKSHSGLLTVMISDIIKYAGYQLSHLSAVAVSEGPGSYTGLRIGASTAKGLSFSLDIPVITVSTLEAMGRGVQPCAEPGSLLVPMIDARRMEVYCLTMNSAGEVTAAPRPEIIDENSFAQELKGQIVYFFGDGAEKCRPLLGGHTNARFISGVDPSAVHVGEIGLEKFGVGDFADPAYFEPFYLKEFYSPQPKKKS